MRNSSPVDIPDQNAMFDLWMKPFMVLNGWNPFLPRNSIGSHQPYDVFSTIYREWQDFVVRWFNEDSHLLNKIATSKSPDQIWAAYAEFWQKAADDYGKEFATIMKLTAIVTAKGLEATQAADQDGLLSFHVENAA